MTERRETPENYILMLSRFRDGIDAINDPTNAFQKGTPAWLVNEWVAYATQFTDA